MRRSTRSRALWWIDLAEVVTFATIGAVGVGFTGGPDWAIVGVGWLSALVAMTWQEIQNRLPKAKP